VFKNGGWSAEVLLRHRAQFIEAEQAARLVVAGRVIADRFDDLDRALDQRGIARRQHPAREVKIVLHAKARPGMTPLVRGRFVRSRSCLFFSQIG
jgi:hypothetical protein